VKTGHDHEEVNGGGGSPTYIGFVPGPPSAPLEDDGLSLPPELGPFLCDPKMKEAAN
jgi:hypothetical protein